MKEKNKVLVLVQLGTPNSLQKNDVESYLSDFLMDPGTISVPYLMRLFLVKGIIVPRRSHKVIQRYQQIWDPQKGSPLKYHSEDLARALQKELAAEYQVRLAMLYGEPNLDAILSEFSNQPDKELILLPLFPHESSATTDAVQRAVQKFRNTRTFSAQLNWIAPFFSQDWFIKPLAAKIRRQKPEGMDHLLFSFHGMPLKMVHPAHPGETCVERDCMNRKISSGAHCYTQACYETARLLAAQLELTSKDYLVGFQSRFGKNWTGPQTADLLHSLARKHQSVFVVSPSFTADCLETSWEIGISFKEKFLAEGGKAFGWLGSLNSDSDWVQSIANNFR